MDLGAFARDLPTFGIALIWLLIYGASVVMAAVWRRWWVLLPYLVALAPVFSRVPFDQPTELALWVVTFAAITWVLVWTTRKQVKQEENRAI